MRRVRSFGFLCLLAITARAVCPPKTTASTYSSKASKDNPVIANWKSLVTGDLSARSARDAATGTLVLSGEEGKTGSNLLYSPDRYLATADDHLRVSVTMSSSTSVNSILASIALWNGGNAGNDWELDAATVMNADRVCAHPSSLGARPTF